MFFPGGSPRQRPPYKDPCTETPYSKEWAVSILLECILINQSLITFFIISEILKLPMLSILTSKVFTAEKLHLRFLLSYIYFIEQSLWNQVVYWYLLLFLLFADPCYPNPGLNAGSCQGSSGVAMCTCHPGFTGPICETHSMLCMLLFCNCTDCIFLIRDILWLGIWLVVKIIPFILKYIHI